MNTTVKVNNCENTKFKTLLDVDAGIYCVEALDNQERLIVAKLDNITTAISIYGRYTFIDAEDFNLWKVLDVDININIDITRNGNAISGELF